MLFITINLSIIESNFEEAFLAVHQVNTVRKSEAFCPEKGLNCFEQTIFVRNIFL